MEPRIPLSVHLLDRENSKIRKKIYAMKSITCWLSGIKKKRIKTSRMLRTCITTLKMFNGGLYSQRNRNQKYY